MRVCRSLIPLFTALLVLAAATAHARAQAQDADSPDEAAPPSWPTADVIDLWHKLRPKDQSAEQDTTRPPPSRQHFFVVAPAIGSKPSTGVTLGVNGNMAFFQGDEATTHISSMAGGIRVSQKKQVLSNVRFSVFTDNDRWFLQGDNRLNWTSLNTYPLGSDAGTLG